MCGMKILYLCNYYHRAMIFRDAMDIMAELGHDVLAFNSVEFGEPIDEKYRSIMDDKVIHCECYRKNDRYFYHVKQNKIYRKLLEKTDVSSFNLIHSHTLFNGGWVARKAYHRLGVPYVVTVRNTDLNANLQYPFFIPIARMIVKDSQKVLFLSESYREAFLKKCYTKKERDLVYSKTEVVLNGLENFWLENRWNERRECHRPLRLLCVGKIDRNKNMKTVLETANQLNQEGCPTMLTIIGKVVDERVRENLMCGNHVELLPFMKKEELIHYYREADIYVMPSFHESFGRVYAEAMTQGMPVIYSRGQGFDGIFPEGEIGYSVDPSNVAEIKQAIKKILEKYPTMSQKCVDSSGIFDWKIISSRLQKIYLVAGSKGVKNESSTIIFP